VSYRPRTFTPSLSTPATALCCWPPTRAFSRSDPTADLPPPGRSSTSWGSASSVPTTNWPRATPGLRVDLPQPVGLIETTDGGRSWTPLSRQGESAFHALTTSDAGILGFDGALRRSVDGRTWEQLTIPAEPHSLSAAPDGTTVLAATAQGPLRSADAGASWSPVAGAPLLQVVTWAGEGSTAVRVDPGGRLWTSSDAGGSWQEGAVVGAAPNAVAADADTSRIVVVTEAGLLESIDGGATFTPRLVP
jgi:photosystem II stability/assembly factor-like uncharacterized protein